MAERLKMTSEELKEGVAVAETGVPKIVEDAFANAPKSVLDPDQITDGWFRGGRGPAEGRTPPDTAEPQAGGPGRTDGGSGEGNGGDDGGTPEGPRGPERSRGPELEPNPERDRWLVDEIVRLRTDFTIQERYK